MIFKKTVVVFIIISILFQPLISLAVRPGNAQPPPADNIDFTLIAPVPGGGNPDERGGALNYVDFIEAQVEMRLLRTGDTSFISLPVLKFIQVPEACKLSNSKITVSLYVDNQLKVLSEFNNRPIYEVAIQGSSFTPNSSLFPASYKSGRFDFVIQPRDDKCMPPPSISFRPQLAAEFGSFLSPFIGFDLPANASFGNMLQSFAVSFLVDYLSGLIFGKVPTSDKGAQDTIKRSMGETLRAQLEQIKQQMIQTLKEAGQYIALRIFNSIITRLFQTVAKLQIKDPQMYALLNAMGGMFIGMHKFQEKGCVDPAVAACYQANVTNMVTSFKNQTADTRVQQSAQLGLAALVARMQRCPTSKIDEVITPAEPIQPEGRGREEQGLQVLIEGGQAVSLRNVFEKVPFFAQVLETRDSQNLTAQVRRRNRAFQPRNPVGNFVEGGLVNIMQSQLCQNVIFDLQNTVVSAIAEKAEQVQEEIKAGFQGVKRCVKPIPGMPRMPVTVGVTLCQEEQTTTPAGTVKYIADKVADSERELAAKKAGSNPDPAVNVFISWFRNWLYTKINTTLIKGLDEANDIPRVGNTALANLGNKTNLEKTCRSLQNVGNSGNSAILGNAYRGTCEEAYTSQVGMGAEFDKLQAQELIDQYNRVLTKLQNVFNLYGSLAQLFSETKTKFETYLDRLSTEFVPDWNKIEDAYNQRSADIENVLGGLCDIVSGERDRASRVDQVNRVCKNIQTGQLKQLLEELETLKAGGASQAIGNTQKEIDTIQSTIATAQQEILQSLAAVSQKLGATRLASLFSRRLTAVPNSPPASDSVQRKKYDFSFLSSSFKNFDSGFIDKFLDFKPNELRQRYRVNNIPVYNGKIIFDNDLVYFLNQDLAGPANTTLSYGIVQATLNYLIETFTTDRVLTEKQLKEKLKGIGDLFEYFNNKAAVYQKMGGFFNNQTVILAIGYGQTEEILISTILGDMNEIIPPLVNALQKIKDEDLIRKLQDLKIREDRLGSQRAALDIDIDKKFDDILKALSSADLDFPRAEVELNKIETETEFLYNDTLLLRKELSLFHDDLIFEIQNLPSQPPTEEPATQGQLPNSKMSERVTRAETKSLPQKIFALVIFPLKAAKMILGNIFSIKDERRVKLK